MSDLYDGDAVLLNYPVKALGDYHDAYVPMGELPSTTQELYGYDPVRGRDLLAEAGYPNGLSTEVITTSNSAHLDLLAVIQQHWAGIGVDLQITVLDYGAYVAALYGRTYEQMIFANGLGSSRPCAALSWETGANLNASMISDPWLDQQAAAMRADFLDPQAQAGMMRQVVPYILDHAWYIQPPNTPTHTLWHPWLEGYAGEQVPGHDLAAVGQLKPDV